MVLPLQDALELLLPEETPEGLQRARRVTTFLRLLCDDARPARADSVHVDLDHARGELERERALLVQAALEDLLRHYLAAALGEQSFLWLGQPAAGLESLWHSLCETRRERPWLPRLAAPAEPAACVAERLFAAARRAGLDAAALGLWGARLEGLRSGPLAAQAAFRAQLAGARKQGRSNAQQAAALAGLIESLLERSAVRSAATELEQHATLVEHDERLRQLALWTRVALGEIVAARALQAGLTIWLGPLPAALSELRERRPEWLSLLSGRRTASEAAASEAAASETGASETGQLPAQISAQVAGSPLDRAQLGAVFCAVLRLRPAARWSSRPWTPLPACARELKPGCAHATEPRPCRPRPSTACSSARNPPSAIARRRASWTGPWVRTLRSWP